MRAEALGISPSALVRSAVVAEIDRAEGGQFVKPDFEEVPAHSHRARLCLRMSAEHAALVVAAGRRAGMRLGDYVGRLAANVPAIAHGGGYRDHIAELRASTAELATLSRNIHRLTDLLRQGNLEQARPYRELLDRLAGDVRAHLEIAALVLANLRPCGQGPAKATVTSAQPGRSR